MVFVWSREDLLKLFKKDNILKNVFDSLIGKDISKKLFSVHNHFLMKESGKLSNILHDAPLLTYSAGKIFILFYYIFLTLSFSFPLSVFRPFMLILFIVLFYSIVLLFFLLFFNQIFSLMLVDSMLIKKMSVIIFFKFLNVTDIKTTRITTFSYNKIYIYFRIYFELDAD